MEAQNNENGGGLGVKIGIISVLLIAVVLVIALKSSRSGEAPREDAADRSAEETVDPLKTVTEEQTGPENINDASDTADVEKKTALPKLLDLGAGTCIPCKMMEPILEELTKEYAGKLDVQFIDVRKDPDAGRKYGTKLIPTQIFFDASGKELFRHEGFYSREDILNKWKELGIDLSDDPVKKEKETGSIEEPVPSAGSC